MLPYLPYRGALDMLLLMGALQMIYTLPYLHTSSHPRLGNHSSSLLGGLEISIPEKRSAALQEWIFLSRAAADLYMRVQGLPTTYPRLSLATSPSSPISS